MERIDTNQVKATRKDLHFARRFFHMSGGLTIGVIYQSMLSHQQAIYILGMAACMIYLLEQIRIHYPEFASHIAPFSKYLFRAEEQLKESAGIPFLMGLLLTLLTFPKMISLIAIYTLAFSDPLSAIIGIKYGKKKLSKDKTLEGSLAFFISSFVIALTIISMTFDGLNIKLFLMALVGAVGITLFELIPIKIDDNLTIPLATSVWFWILKIIIL